MVARRSEADPDAPARRDGLAVSEVAARAVREFSGAFGQQAHRVTGVRRTDDGGWSVLVDVVELERIPQSTSLLATYRVDVDDHGRLVGYERLRRFTRGSADPT